MERRLVIFTLWATLLVSIPARAVLVGHWTFDETAGLTASDSSGRNHHGTLQNMNGNEWTPGLFNNALDFDRVDDRVHVPDHSDLDMSNQFTLMAWIRPDTLPGGGLMTIASKDENYEYHLQSNGSVYWWWQQANGRTRTLTTAGGLVSPGQWFHVAIRFRNNQQNIFINGVNVASSSFRGGLRRNADPFLIGQDLNFNSRTFDGLIDDVRLYDTFLSDQEIRDLAIIPPTGCATAFRDAIQSHTAGVLNFGWNAYLSGNPDTLLDVGSVSGGGGTPTCQSANCSATGSASDALPAQPLPDTSTATVDVTVPANGSATIGNSNNHYRIVTFNDTGTLNVSSNYSEYFIHRINLGNRSTLNLVPGDYWIGSLSSGDQTRINVVGNGTVRLFINSDFRMGNQFQLNSPAVGSGGDASRVFLYINGQLTTNSQPTVSGFMYATGDVSLGWSARVFGAVAGANLTLGSSTVITYDSIALRLLDLGQVCSGPVVDHFRIEHAGSGVTCMPELVTLSARDASGNVVTGYTGTVNLSTSTGLGDWLTQLAPQQALNSDNSGNASYTFVAADQGVKPLYLQHRSVGAVNLNVVDNGVTESPLYDNDLLFAASGFRFLADGLPLINSQVSGKPFATAPNGQQIELQAIRTDSQTGACEAALTGTQAVELAFECEDPATCYGNHLQVNGSAIPGNSQGNVVNYGTLNLDFGNSTDSTAPLSIRYDDAGKIHLHARKALLDAAGNPTGEWMAGQYQNLVVVPFAFHLAVSDEPNAVDASGTTYRRAGENFSVTVRAVQWQAGDNASNNADLGDNPLAANFGTHNDVVAVLSHQVQDPPGSNGLLNGAGNYTQFRDTLYGQKIIPLQWHEVGILKLQVQVTDYLGSGVAINGSRSNIGRFYPYRFEISPVQNGAFRNGTGSWSCNFTYQGQPFGISPANTIQLQISARSANGTMTANYGNAYWKLSNTALSNRQYQDEVGGNAVLATSSLGSVSFSGQNDYDGLGMFEIGADQLVYQKGSITPAASDVPFNAQVSLQLMAADLTDDDGVCLGVPGSCGNYTHSGITGTELRYGRLAIDNALGSELLPLALPVRTEYWQGVGSQQAFVTNTADNNSCMGTSLGAAQFVLGNFQGDLAAGETTLSAGSFSQGQGSLMLSAPGAGNTGSLTVQGSLVDSWLWYDWQQGSAGEEAPSATASFGIHGGSDPVIYLRELYR